jgi:hypothetical protein
MDPKGPPESAYQFVINGVSYPVVTCTTDLTTYDNLPPETEAAWRERLRARFAAILDEMGTLTDELDEIMDDLEGMS